MDKEEKRASEGMRWIWGNDDGEEKKIVGDVMGEKEGLFKI